MRPLSSKQAAENAGQHPDRILRAAAEDAGMQIAVGGLDPHLLVDQPAQRGGDRRRIGVPHAGVADQREVGLEVVLVRFEKRNEILRSDFLLALDDDGDVERQRTGHGFPGPAGLDEGHQLALVVLGAARDDDLSSVGMVGDGGLERRTMPEIERIDRLHVVMAVEQHMRPRPPLPPPLALGDDGGMTGGRPDLGRKTERRDIPGQMIGRRLAIAGKGRIGRDRFDPQQRKQPLQAVVEIGIDAVEDRLKLRRAGHVAIFPGWRGISACRVVARRPPETRQPADVIQRRMQDMPDQSRRQSRRWRRDCCRRPADRSEKPETTGTSGAPRPPARPMCRPARRARIIGRPVDQDGHRKEQPHEIILPGQRRGHRHQAEQDAEFLGIRPRRHPRARRHHRDEIQARSPAISPARPSSRS